MPQKARRYYEQYDYSQPRIQPEVVHLRDYVRPEQPQTIRRVKKRVRKVNPVQKIAALIFMLFVCVFAIIPSFEHVTLSFLHGSLYPAVKTDLNEIRFPTLNYLTNHWAYGQRSLRGVRIKKPLMEPIKENQELTGLESNLKNLMAQYPTIHSAVYAIDLDNGNYADINAQEMFSAASIIKLPVLVHLFRSIEMGQFALNDKMQLTNYYRAEGSGNLQFKAEGSSWTIDELAQQMITQSDNSSTNMLVAKLGSMNDVNHGIREWGLGHTYLENWLPDIEGTNKTTARDMATILYNIDDPKFLSVASREKIFDYMGHVHNDRLLPAGLGAGANIAHKTGDIGTMLGDAGIVYTPGGKKYIVVILANRPHNSPLGKEFIVKASGMIYNNMVEGFKG
jgi:beta-lactamase class A